MDTIAAISTAPGMGGIGIVRMSGDNAFEILLKVFKSRKVKKIDDIVANTIIYGHIYDGDEVVDEVMVSFFKNPHSYTREDICEINTHGGTIVMKKILQLVIDNGARMAESGEFTKRAFLNGRIDLTQVESISSILTAKSESELMISNELLKGRLLDKIKKVKAKLMDVLMHIEVSIDYPEYDTDEKTKEEIGEAIHFAKKEICSLENNFDIGKKIKDGINVSIIGRPNAGKSSLLNMILDDERAIVTDIEGTTRDSIEETINIDGFPINIIDTAGIRKTDEIVEKIGIDRAIKIANDSDVVIAIIDVSRQLNEEDKMILDLASKKDSIIILNKMDLEKKVDIEKLEKEFEDIIKVSILNNEGLDEIIDMLRKRVNKLKETKTNDIIIIHERQKEIIKETIKEIEETEKQFEILPVDMLSEYITGIISKLNELTGEDVREELLSEIFSNFCLGK